jgi:hypothetical protein
MAATTRTISELIEFQVPDFVREDHSRFVEFVKTYYEWLETTGQVINQSTNLLRNQDIDYSEDKYLEKLFKEFLADIPVTIATDKANLLKNIRQFYLARGTEKSFELFFRFFYGLNPEFYYPRVDILKPSDGKWIEQQSIRVFSLIGSPNDFTSNRIRGRSSNTTAFVERVILIQKESFIGYELILNASSITGNFIPGELIELNVQNTNVVAQINAVAEDIQFSKTIIGVERSGVGYSVGDRFKINSIPNYNVAGSGLEIEVTSVETNGKIKTFKIIDYGLGYNKDISIVEYPLVSPTAIETAYIDVNFSALITYDGYYLNEDGQLSASKYIHDGEFYQQFSYVIYVNESINVYKDAVDKLIHPAGFKMFGGFRTQELFNGSTKVAQSVLSRNINYKVTDLSVDVINANLNVTDSINRPNVNLGTTLTYVHQTSRSPNTYPLGPSRYSIFRDRLQYKPVSKYDANSEIPNYFGTFGNLSAQYAITPVSVFDKAGLTPFNIETMLYESTNILPDSVIKTQNA